MKFSADLLRLKQLRMEIYKFYQDSFSKEELAEIRALRGFLEGLKITLKNLGVVLLVIFLTDLYHGKSPSNHNLG